MLRRTLLAGLMLLILSLLAADAAAQRFGRPRSPRRPTLPAPFNTLSGAQAQLMGQLAEVSVDWLIAVPSADGGDPVIDLFGPSIRRVTNEEGEEVEQNDLGELVLSTLTPQQRRMLLDLTKRQNAYMASYAEGRSRLVAKLASVRGETKVDRDVDREVRELGEALGELEGKMAFDQAVTYAKLAETLTEDQKIFLRRMRENPDSINREADSVVEIRDALAKLEFHIQYPLQDYASKAGSFLTGTAADNARAAPRRVDILGETSRRPPEHVTTYLRDVTKGQHQEYLKLLAADAEVSLLMLAKRQQFFEAVDQQKRLQTASDTKIISFAKQCGELESRRALARVRAFEKIRGELTAEQRFTLQQVAE